MACSNEKIDIQEPTLFKVVSISDSLGNNYPIKIARTTDTTWVYPRIKNDTLKGLDGKFLRDANNKYIIKYDTTYNAGLKTAKYVLLDTVLLPSIKGTMIVEVETNARWMAPMQKFDWLVPILSTGGGNGRATFKIEVGKAKRRSQYKPQQVVMQSIFSRDSLVMYQIILNQKSYKE